MTGHSLNIIQFKVYCIFEERSIDSADLGDSHDPSKNTMVHSDHVQSSRLSLWFSGDVDIRWRSFQKRFRESIVFKYIARIQEIFTWTEKTRFPRILVIGFTKLPKEFSVFPRVHGRFPQKRNYANHKMPTNDENLRCCTHILVHSYCFAPRVGVLLGLKARLENNLYGIYQLFRST